jgi:peptidyl-prolyl cis-trans isomerase D
MIEFVRKRKKGIINFILLGLAVVLMVSFGLESFAPTRYQNQIAVTVNGEEVARIEFDRKLRSVEQLYQNQFQGAYADLRAALNLPQRVVDQLIDERLLGKFFEELSLTSSVAQVEERIAALPFFGGRVDRASYLAYLRGTGMSEAKLEAEIRKEILEGELQNALAHILSPVEGELKRIYEARNEEAEFKIASLELENVSSQVSVSEEELETYYKENGSYFTVPKGFELELLKLSPELFIDKVQPADEELKELYESRKEEFREEAQYLLHKIAFKREAESAESSTGENSSSLSPNDKRRTQAQMAIDRFAKGEKFEALAREIGDSDELKKVGGKLGWKKQSELNDDVLAGIEDLTVGSVSSIVEDAEEIAVYFLEDKKTEKFRDFAEVAPVLKRDLQLLDAPVYLEMETEKLLEDLRNKTVTLADVAVNFKTEPVATRTVPEALKGSVQEALEGDFLKYNEGDTVVIARVVAVTPERRKGLDEVRSEVLQILRKKRARELIAERAKELIAELSAKGVVEFEELAARHGFKVTKTERKKRKEAEFPFTEKSAELYQLSSAKPLFDSPILSENSAFVVMLTEKIKPQDLSKARELLASEAAATGKRGVDSLVQVLRQQSKIIVNPEILLDAGEV